jgi:hypothetical protein
MSPDAASDLANDLANSVSVVVVMGVASIAPHPRKIVKDLVSKLKHGVAPCQANPGLA